MKIGESFVFDVEKVQSEELSQCREGDYVNLWVPKDTLHKVYVFRRGSIGGTGRVGYVKSKYSGIIATHLSKGLKYETQIIEINVAKSLCKIQCRLISPEETAAKQVAEVEEAASSLRSELQKRYTVKNSLSIRVQLPKNHKLKEGQELYLEKQPLEYYLRNAQRLHVNFTDKDGVVIARKTNEPKLIRSVLRAFFSQCAMKFHVTSIETPDKYTLNYVEHIEAKVEVSFGENA